jgi:transaldolase
LPAYAPLIDAALASAQGADAPARLADAGDRLAVAIGAEILRFIPGRVSTECDARHSFDTDATLAQARKLVALYQPGASAANAC